MSTVAIRRIILWAGIATAAVAILVTTTVITI